MDDTKVTTLKVTTKSGREYEIDLDGKRFRRHGDAKVWVQPTFGNPTAVDDPHADTWITYRKFELSSLGHLVFLDTNGHIHRSTAVRQGLIELLYAMDE